jgi:hypothetical protein
MTSFFGGDHTMSHFSPDPYYKLAGEPDGGDRNRRKADFTKLKELGYKKQYFQYKNKDEKAKAKAKAAAEAFSTKWFKKSGIKLEVREGFFL